jgi:hypothetical protein
MHRRALIGPSLRPAMAFRISSYRHVPGPAVKKSAAPPDRGFIRGRQSSMAAAGFPYPHLGFGVTTSGFLLGLRAQKLGERRQGSQ